MEIDLMQTRILEVGQIEGIQGQDSVAMSMVESVPCGPDEQQHLSQFSHDSVLFCVPC